MIAWTALSGLLPWANSEQHVDPNTTEAAVDVAAHPGGPWIGRLKNGVTVELIGVGEQDNKTWWKPDGSPLAEAPCEITDRSSSSDKTEIIRLFFASVKNRPSEPVGMKYEVEPSSFMTSIAVKQHGRRATNFAEFMAFGAGLSGNERVAVVRCGIAAGPWTEPLAAWTPDRQSHGRASDLSQPIEAKDGVVIVASDSLTDELHVIAVCNDGRELVARLECDIDQSVTETPPGGVPRTQRRRVTRATFAGTALKQIREIKLQGRPYEWVEFRNVSLNPGHKTNVEVGGRKMAHSYAAPRRP